MRFTGTRRQWLQSAMSLVAFPAFAQDDQTGGDPLGSMQYPSLREQTIGKASARFVVTAGGASPVRVHRKRAGPAHHAR